MTKSKNIEKIGALLLALVMMFSVLMTIMPQASAADVTIDTTADGSLTIYKLDSKGLTESEYNDATTTGGDSRSDYHFNSTDGLYYKYLNDAEYTIYHIGNIAQSTDSNGNVTVQYIDAKDGTTVIDLSDLDSYVAGLTLSDYNPQTRITGSDGIGKAEFKSLDLGLYYVKETATPAGYSISNNFYVQIPMTETDENGKNHWEYDVVAYPKNGNNGGLDKEITGGTTTDDGKKTAGLGSTVEYKITATTPSNLITTTSDGTVTVNYKNFMITDKANKYLTVDPSSVTVTAVDSNGAAINLTAGSDYKIEQSLNVTTDGTEYNYTYVKFDESGLKKLGNNAVVTVTYSAKVASEIDNELLVEIDNEAYFQYTVNGSDIIGPKDKETVYTCSYSAQKVDDNGAALKGAKFVLAQYLDNNSKPATTGTLNYLTYDSTNGWGYTTDISKAYEVTSSDGTDGYVEGLFAFRGLAAGDYLLIETAAPAGYTLLKDPVSITINSNTTTTANAKDASNNYNAYTIQIVNSKNDDIILPTTGGSGIYLYIIVGAALIAISAGIYIKGRKSKKSAQ